MRLGTRCPSTMMLTRPRYGDIMLGLTSVIKSATTLLGCTIGDSGRQFVITARTNVLRRVRGGYPRGAFVPTPPGSDAYKYGRYGFVQLGALRGLCGYLGCRFPRMAISPRITERTMGPVGQVLRVSTGLNLWANYRWWIGFPIGVRYVCRVGRSCCACVWECGAVFYCWRSQLGCLLVVDV